MLLDTSNAAFAPLRPSATARSSCERRTRTSANSATTKKAFIARKTITNKMLNAVINITGSTS